MIVTHEIVSRNDADTAVALGYFDGVHIGHREVIRAAVEQGEIHGAVPTVFTFGAMPGSKDGATLLQTEKQKDRVIDSLGVEQIICPDFDDIKNLSPEGFFHELLLDGLKARVLTCGFNYRFGYKAAGDVDLMRRLCSEAGVILVTLMPVIWQGEPVSSTRIRGAVREGDMRDAREMLGNCFTIEGEVVHGRHLGTRLGWPTINQRIPEGFTIPRFGVYHTSVALDSGIHRGVTNVGIKPTVDGEHLSCETHILDYSGDLYGRELSVEFLDFIRPEMKFASVRELNAQVERDIQKVARADI